MLYRHKVPPRELNPQEPVFGVITRVSIKNIAITIFCIDNPVVIKTSSIYLSLIVSKTRGLIEQCYNDTS